MEEWIFYHVWNGVSAILCALIAATTNGKLKRTAFVIAIGCAIMTVLSAWKASQ